MEENLNCLGNKSPKGETMTKEGLKTSGMRSMVDQTRSNKGKESAKIPMAVSKESLLALIRPTGGAKFLLTMGVD